MIGEDYNEQEEERNRSKVQKVNGETDRPAKKSKRNKSKTCTHCKELKLKIQELEQLNTKLMQTNKSLKESNKDANQKLNEALKENENLVKENEKLQKLLQELDHENNLKKINKKILIKKMGSKSESSEAEEEIDLIVVPGVAFDKQHNRMGRGKAYYDKLLTRLTCPKVGLCFDFQLLVQ